MNGNADAAQAWLQKAASDLTAAELCTAAGKALDVACLHSQQAAEKSLKAWLIAWEIPFPFVHDLGKLVTLCARQDPEFEGLRSPALALNPFAVEMRYDAEFWPTASDTDEALRAAHAIHQMVVEHWPR